MAWKAGSRERMLVPDDLFLIKRLGLKIGPLFALDYDAAAPPRSTRAASLAIMRYDRGACQKRRTA